MIRVYSILVVVWLFCRVHSAEETKLPPTWSWTNVDGVSYIARLQNHLAPYYCRSDWAFSVTSALSARLKIASDLPHQTVVLSAQVLLNCSPGNCSGGNPYAAYEYISKGGIPDETCQNYEGIEDKCDALGICRDCLSPNSTYPRGYCYGVEKYNLYGLQSYGDIKADIESGESIVEKMKDEIHNNGPITCTLYPSEEFNNYKGGGIISDSSSQSSTPHYVNIIGWEDKLHSKAWIGENSWGIYWGNNGFFKIEMGTNALKIESQCSFGIPKELHSIPPTNLVNQHQKYKPCNCIIKPPDFTPILSFSSDIANAKIPKSYDIRNLNGKNYATIDRNQHIPQYCGSCWVFAPVSALSDRFSLMFGGDKTLFDMAVQVPLNCISYFASGCYGGWPNVVYDYIQDYDIPHESCAPYRAADQECTPLNSCKKCGPDSSCTVVNKTEYLSFSISTYGFVKGEKAMKREIASGGPLSCLIDANDIFHAYTGGLMQNTNEEAYINHAVEVGGWGKENGVEYWIVRNSWGTYWGENGWARIVMGREDFGLAQNECIWAKPKDYKRSHLDVESVNTKFQTQLAV